LIEEYPCSSKDAKNAREGHYIRELNCVNKVIPGRTGKQYNEDNKEKRKEYYQQNYNKIVEKRKETFICLCGSTLRKNDKARHEKSIKHQNHLKQMLENSFETLEKNVVIKNEDL
jgi:hypothetical protein